VRHAGRLGDSRELEVERPDARLEQPNAGPEHDRDEMDLDLVQVARPQALLPVLAPQTITFLSPAAAFARSIAASTPSVTKARFGAASRATRSGMSWAGTNIGTANGGAATQPFSWSPRSNVRRPITTAQVVRNSSSTSSTPRPGSPPRIHAWMRSSSSFGPAMKPSSDIDMSVLIWTGELFQLNIEAQRFLDRFGLNFFSEV